MLEKFNKNYVLKITCFKDVYEDDWNNGEGEHVQSMDCDWIKSTYTINENTDITNLIIETFNKKAYPYKDYEKIDFCLCDNRICTSIMENGDAIAIKADETDYKTQKVYTCHYDIMLSINGENLDAEDLQELTSFEY